MSVFLDISEDKHIFESKSFFVIRDNYPVSPGHSLIISKEVKVDYFSLTNEERTELQEVILLTKKGIEKEFSPDGYNIGMNCGKVAGQTVMHFHCHVIPRYVGDMNDPRGGVRGVIPDKQKY